VSEADRIFLGRAQADVFLLPRYANRHGLVAGATGTGKTVTLQVLAEAFSRLGVPVFAADVKGDLAGISQPAGPVGDKLRARLEKIGLSDFRAEAAPVVFWDVHGEKGHPVRATVSEMGPVLLARILELNDTQEGVLSVAFRVADDEGLLLLDLDDLRAILGFLSENAKDVSARYGLVTPTTVAAIQRALLRLEDDGGASLFGEPALELEDLMRQDLSGRGVVNLLCADKLILRPRVYSTFLLWLLAELFEQLPEVGDLDRPRLVFFFDEAHLLFDDAPAALRERVEQVVRLVRSKGVGVFFVSQLPDDVPDAILSQLGNRIQHALRAHTPKDRKSVKVAAENFVPNPAFEVSEAITQLGVGEALISTLQEGAIPGVTQRTLLRPPSSRIGAITDEERALARRRSPVGAKYDTAIDRESAHEILEARARRASAPEAAAPASTPIPSNAEPQSARDDGWDRRVREALFGTSRRQGMIEAMGKSTVRTIGNQLGRRILRGILGSITR
jgi:DNA helicase HerA-like ATPase